MADPPQPPPYRASVFSFLSRAGAASLHAQGRPATDQLLSWISPHATDTLLEIGCGTGHTLAVATGRYGCILYGVDANPDMLTMCHKRLHFCKLAKRVRVTHADFTVALPFDDGTFDQVYAESVLAFQPRTALMTGLREIRRVLKPGGRLWGNETLWLPETSAATIADWNAACISRFGIIQAAPDLKGVQALKPLLAEAGFAAATFQSQPLADPARPAPPVSDAERRSLRFTRLHTLAGYLRPGLIRQRLRQRKIRPRLNPKAPVMEGVLYSIQASLL